MTPTPELRRVVLSGLDHALWRWPAKGRGLPCVLLLHGFLDQGDSFHELAVRLVEGGCAEVLALDFRGHGRSEWIGLGGYYHFPDYVRDLSELVYRVPELAAPFVLAGHSMGGTVATQAAGALGGRLSGLVLLEGLGPPGVFPEDAPERMRRWLESLARHAEGRVRRFRDLEEASERLRHQFPELHEGIIADFARRCTVATPEGLTWRYDPLHRTHSPSPFLAAAFEAFAGEVEVPVLLVTGAASAFGGAEDPRLQRRAAAFRRSRTCVVPGAGHMLHLSHPAAVAKEILGWLVTIR